MDDPSLSTAGHGRSFEAPLFVGGRWQLAEFVFFEFRSPGLFIVDVGPIPENPGAEQTDQVFEYLSEFHFPWLDLAELQWTLDPSKLDLQKFPGIAAVPVQGPIPHPPAFETASNPDPFHPTYFLRIAFQAISPSAEDPADAVPEDVLVQDLGDEQSPPPSGNPVSPEPSEHAPPDQTRVYLSSRWNPDECKKRLERYAKIPAGSLLTSFSPPSSEYVVTLRVNSFEAEKAGADSDRFPVSFCGSLNPDGEGTQIAGVLEADTPFWTGAGPILGLGGCLIAGIEGVIRFNDVSIPVSGRFVGLALLLAAVVGASGCFKVFQTHQQERDEALRREGPPVLAFVRTVLEAEPAE